MFYNKNLYDILIKIEEKHNILNEQLLTKTNKEEIIKLNIKISKTKNIIYKFLIYKKLIHQFDECVKIVEEEKNSEFIKLAQEEKNQIKKQLLSLEEDFKTLLFVDEKENKKNLIIEMHHAAGGNESAIFVSDLFSAYKKYFEHNKWKCQIIDLQENSSGISSITFNLSGKNSYKKMKFESGVHRVQRVPATESKGRLHTSTITVSVLPEPDNFEIIIDPQELRIDVYRASGAGGQHVNKTESAVRITHLPTGIFVACQQQRSQLSNKDLAMKILKSKLWDLKNQERLKNISDIVKNQVGRGMRSEKIRTYNYPQNRITDHRILFTCNNLDSVMLGNFSILHNELINDEFQKNLKNLIN